jgi:hypothetical protein
VCVARPDCYSHARKQELGVGQITTRTTASSLGQRRHTALLV